MLNKVLSFYTKYFAVWAVVFGVIAYFCPKPFESLKPYMDWFFALTMFGIGAVLEPVDFQRIVQRPTIVLIGTATQYSIMPITAYLIGRAFSLDPQITVGLILTASAPGAMSSSVMSYIAKADTAYSASLTVASTLLAPIATPGLTYLLAQSRLDVPFVPMLRDVLLIVIAPLFIGFAARHYLIKKMDKILPVFPAISATFIIFICSLVIALNRNYLANMTGLILAAAVLMNVIGMAGGYIVAYISRMDIRQRRSLAIEGGMQNAGLGTVIALKHFSGKAAMPAAIFVFLCIFTASIMAAIWQRRPAAPQ